MLNKLALEPLRNEANIHVICVGIIFLFALMFTGVNQSDLFQNFTGFEVDTGKPVLTIVYPLIVFLVYFQYGRRWILERAKENKVLLLLIFFAMASVYWSIDPISTTKRIVHLLFIALIALYVGSALPLKKIIQVFALSFSIITCLSIIMSVVSPETSFSNDGRFISNNQYGALKGVAWDKNTLGLTCVLSIYSLLALLLIWERKSKLSFKVLCLFLMIVSLYVLVKANSATSLAILISTALFASVLLLLNRYKISPGLGAILLLFFLIVGSIAVVLFEVRFGLADFTQLFDRSDTFTGRIAIWEISWNVSQWEPWLGHGYGTIWSPSGEFSTRLHYQYIPLDYGEPIVHAHNGFLHISTTLGIPVAIIAFVFLAYVILRCAFRFLVTHEHRFLLISVMSFITFMHNTTEASFLISRSLLWFVFLVAYFATTQTRPETVRRQAIHGKHHSESNDTSNNGGFKIREKRFRRKKVKRQPQTRSPVR